MATPAFDPAQVDVLLFDLGGVVVDIDFGRCMARWAESSGVDVRELTERFTFDKAYEQHERGAMPTSEYFESLRHSVDIDLTDEEFDAGWNDIYVGIDSEVVAMLAEASRHLPLHAFTNSNPAHQAVWSVRFEEELSVFDSVFVSSELGVRKPDAEAYYEVARLLGVAPSRILFFDDGEMNVAGAVDAGLQAVHVTSVDSVRHALDLLP